MQNKILTALFATLGFCVMLSGTTPFNYVNKAFLREACISTGHRVARTMDMVQKDRWRNLIETGKEEGGGLIADYLIVKRIHEDKKQIQTLTEKGVTNKTLPSIHVLYRDGVALARQYHLETDIVYDYAYFLYWQKDYIASLKLAQRLERYYENALHAEGYRKAKVYNLLGILHKLEMHYEDAEQYYRKAISIWQPLQQQTPVMHYEQALANSLYNLGNLLCATQRNSQGEEMYRKAFAIRQRLAQQNPGNAACVWNLAASYRAMGNLYRKLKHFDEAEASLKKAIEIEERLTKKYPSVNEYVNSLGYSYCSLANLYRAKERCLKAELNYYTANMYFGRVAERNAAYKLDQAYGYYCMAANYDDMFNRNHAIKLYRRAAKLQEEVVKEYSPAILDGLHYVSSLCVLTGFANRYWNKDEEEGAFAVHQSFPGNETSRVYIRELADSYERLFTLQWNRADKRIVEQTGRKAVLLYELLSKETPALYEHDLAHVKFLLGLFYADENRHVEAESLLQDSLRLYMNLAAKGDAEPYAERLQTLRMLLHDEEEYLKEL